MRVIRARLIGRCFFVFCLLIICYCGAMLCLFGTQAVSDSIFFASLLSRRRTVIQGGDDADPDVRIKRDHVKSMMQHAWNGYIQYAWGANELCPISRKPYNDSIYGSAPLGATIVDSLDTLFIMGMMDEFAAARDWIENDMNLDEANVELSLFEVNIRLVGGLLAAFALTGDNLFRQRAEEVAERMLPAFDNVTSIPNGRINLGAKTSSGGWPVLAEWGTLSLEFNYLSDVTGSGVYRSHIRRIYETTINLMVNMDGLYPVNIRMRKNKTKFDDDDTRIHWNNFDKYTLGAAGDSFYEYLLKSWLQSGKTDENSLTLYLQAVNGVFKKLVRTSKKSNLTFLVEIEYEREQSVMGHLTCFAGGLFALGGKALGLERHVELGAALTSTCHQSYVRTPTKLGPETFEFTDDLEAEVDKNGAKYYILRPEVVESYFILWRLTHDPRYRLWGWEAVEAIEKHCRIPSGGYSGLRNVDSAKPDHDDVQQSFFLAETLKYLYLLFSDDSLIALDQWVFNTEAHPLPIKGNVNPLFRPASASQFNN
ncbi:hypothetical protein OUZ56_012862 [Daphnia magna]|uniref:alpha-1,2-Mannosidase n=1 Tax=Daphnia magna TaxID=35525 RepID=A0ABQ9Z495_9CRUS|nr:hypothetical protein OUZ56_012862 [Daphnia magna]